MLQNYSTTLSVRHSKVAMLVLLQKLFLVLMLVQLECIVFMA